MSCNSTLQGLNLTKIMRKVRKATDAAWGADRYYENLNWDRHLVEQDGRDFYAHGELLCSAPAGMVRHDFDMEGAEAARAWFIADGWAAHYTFDEAEAAAGLPDFIRH